MNVPEIRFKGFTAAWVQRKLGEVADIITGSTPSTKMSKYYDGDYLFVSPADIQENRYIDKTITTLTESGFNSGRKVRSGSPLFVCIGSTIGKIGQCKQEAVTNQQINAVVVNEFTNNNFIFSQLQFKSSQIKELANTQAVPIINKSTFSDVYMNIPELSEQVAIGNFFRTLDHTITLHQRKLDGLRELKKGYLQQMFPQAGEKVPKIRFKGFSGDWHERKLGEVVERVTRKNANIESTLPLTISAQFGLISQNEFFDKQIASKDTSNYFLIKNGEFAYNKSYSNGYPWGAVKRLDRYAMGVLSTLYIIFVPIDVESEFLVQYYETNHWYEEVAMRAAEGARNHGLLNITPSDFFDTMLLLPMTTEEQIHIGNFFRNFDERITAHFDKLDQLKELKKAYLQRMFI